MPKRLSSMTLRESKKRRWYALVSLQLYAAPCTRSTSSTPCTFLTALITLSRCFTSNTSDRDFDAAFLIGAD